jgi:hypothetical protein
MTQNREVLDRARPRPRALDLDVPEGTILVRRVAYGAEQEEKETVRVPIFHTSPARVRVAGGITKNLGNYESARVDVMIELPCYPEASEVERTYEYASALLDKLIPEQVEKALSGA